MNLAVKNISFPKARGFTLIELIVATAILVILTGMALPMARVTIKREREHVLRRDLWEMRDAIDRYKDAADRGAFQAKVGTEGYPPDLETLVNGVDVNGKKVRFLRRIPVDPMTGTNEWGLRSMADDPTSDSWGGQNVFDVYMVTTRRGRSRGFTLIELMIVISLILILVSISIPAYNQSILRAKESVLLQNLFTLRSLISQYTLDKQTAPQSLEDLVQGGYIKQIPIDPFTGKNDTWTVDQEDYTLSVDQQETGITDVHSGSSQISTTGKAYSSW